MQLDGLEHPICQLETLCISIHGICTATNHKDGIIQAFPFEVSGTQDHSFNRHDLAASRRSFGLSEAKMPYTRDLRVLAYQLHTILMT